MKKIIAFVSALSIVAALAVPASAATGRFDINKARPSINNTITEIVTAPAFDWSEWLNQFLSRYK